VTGFKARLAELSGEQPLSDELKKLSEKERENEKKDVEGLIGDLEVKIEELKAAPEANDPVSESIKHLLGGGSEGAFARAGESSTNGQGKANAAPAGPVNDLTSMVKKKKKVVPAQPGDAKGKAVDIGEKRKVEVEEDGDAKKARVE
jgi:HAT1-interacting factor 1